MVLRQLTARTLLLVVFETVLIVGAVAVAAWLRLGDRALEVIQTESAVPKGLLIALVCQICLYYAELYDLRVVADRRELLVRILQALGSASLILAILYFWIPDLVIGRGIFLIASGLIVAVVIGWRLAFDWTSARVGPRERLLLVGTNAAAVALA